LFVVEHFFLARFGSAGADGADTHAASLHDPRLRTLPSCMSDVALWAMGPIEEGA
jgi:hypothetical protein